MENDKQPKIEWYDLKVQLLEIDHEERLESYVAYGIDEETGLEYEGVAIFVCDELQHVEDVILKDSVNE